MDTTKNLMRNEMFKERLAFLLMSIDELKENFNAKAWTRENHTDDYFVVFAEKLGYIEVVNIINKRRVFVTNTKSEFVTVEDGAKIAHEYDKLYAERRMKKKNGFSTTPPVNPVYLHLAKDSELFAELRKRGFSGELQHTAKIKL